MKDFTRKVSEKYRAIHLRTQGQTYSEILSEVNVSKSTLSLWLKNVGLAPAQQQEITQKRIDGQAKGARARKRLRIDRQTQIGQLTQQEVGIITDRELWLIGTALYWAEGSKQKEYNPSEGVQFSNSDPRMISLFIQFAQKILKIPESHIYCEIYLHRDYKNDVSRFIKYWSLHTGFPENHFTRIYYKTHKNRTYRKNKGALYYGLLRVNIAASTDLNRKITGWTNGIIHNCGIV